MRKNSKVGEKERKKDDRMKIVEEMSVNVTRAEGTLIVMTSQREGNEEKERERETKKGRRK